MMYVQIPSRLYLVLVIKEMIRWPKILCRSSKLIVKMLRWALYRLEIYFLTTYALGINMRLRWKESSIVF
jgi:hypothetical protein